MDLLTVLIGEFLAPLAVPALLMLATIVFFLAGSALEVVLTFRGLPSLFHRAGATLTASRWHRRLCRTLAAAFGLSAFAALLLNTVLFEPALRWGMSRAKDKTGVDVTFGSASGDFFSGRMTLRGVAVRRQDPLRSNIDLRVAEARGDVAMTSVFGSHVRIETLRLSGLAGEYQRGRLPAPRRDFMIDLFVLENSSIVLREPPEEGRTSALPLTFESLECRPLRRSTALLDLLFRSTARGTIAGAPLEIRTERADPGRRTIWKASAIPVRFLGDYIGEPFDWLASGTADVDVLHIWPDGVSPIIDSHWKILFHGVAAEVPARITGFRRSIAVPVAKFLQAHPVGAPLEFDLQLHEGQFTGAQSIESTRLLAAVAEGVREELARKAKVPAEKIKELGRRTLDGFKRFIEERKKK